MKVRCKAVKFAKYRLSCRALNFKLFLFLVAYYRQCQSDDCLLEKESVTVEILIEGEFILWLSCERVIVYLERESVTR